MSAIIGRKTRTCQAIHTQYWSFLSKIGHSNFVWSLDDNRNHILRCFVTLTIFSSHEHSKKHRIIHATVIYDVKILELKRRSLRYKFKISAYLKNHTKNRSILFLKLTFNWPWSHRKAQLSHIFWSFGTLPWQFVRVTKHWKGAFFIPSD